MEVPRAWAYFALALEQFIEITTTAVRYFEKQA